MRLLKRAPNSDLVLVSVDDESPPPYAILSHTWTDGEEVTYDEVVAGVRKDKAGRAKLHFCADRAAQDKLQYFWVDTCCIDKSNAQEYQTAINSMFRYYQRASKCYVYLTDVQVPNEVVDVQQFRITWEVAFRTSRWFTRGWTLQELLGPAMVEFYSKESRLLGSKISLEKEIYEITKIPIAVLRGQGLSEISIEERMSWVAKRTTTFKEDIVYCLLGIFGVFLPLNYGEGEAYATLRLREEIQKRQEGRGTESLDDLTISTSLPFSRNELFTGRENELQSLEQFLSSSTKQRMTIYGLGGCGKSALALELAYRMLAQHAGHLVFWVPAMSRESFELAYREIGIRLRIPGITDDNADVKRLVKETLSSNGRGRWLIIVDNADDPAVLMGGAGGADSGDSQSSWLFDCLPKSNVGKILFTTRSRKAAEELTPSSVLEVTDMNKSEVRQLLELRITKKELMVREKKPISELLELLAYLPLAIVQAVAFINENGITISAYVSLFKQVGTSAELFSERFNDHSRYREMDSTIAKTWHISFDQIQRQDPLAIEFLSYMACIDRINIPLSLLPPGGSLVQQTKAIGTLKGYAFITERQQTMQELESEPTFDMHRLVHMASEWWLDGHSEQAVSRTRVAVRLEELVPYGGHEKRKVWTAYLPHAIHLARPDNKLDEMARASLLSRIGRCQSSLGQYSAAEKTHRQELSIKEQRLGREDSQTLRSMNDVGLALIHQGKYEESESMNRETLARTEKVLGPEHPYTLTSMNNLALMLSRQGKYKEAKSMNRETLARKEKVLGPEHPDTLASMSNLALVLSRQGKYEEAESMNRETLARREKVLGPEHPDTLTSMSNLASVLDRQGKYEEAESMNRETLARKEKVLGPEHPDTLTSMSNLASVLDSQGKYEEAESMNRETLARREKVLGPEHPDTLTSMNNLASVLDSQGKYEEAESMNRETLARKEKVLGPEHPDTLMSMSNLASVLSRQGKYKEAKSMNRETLARREKVLGPEHPYTLTSMNNLALMLSRQGKYKEAKSMNRETLARKEKVLGPEHPDTLTSMSNLASVLDSQGKYEEAESMNRETLARREKVLGPEHPDTLTSMNNLASVLDSQGKYEEAESMNRETLARKEKVLGPEHPDTLMSMSNLASVLSRQGKYKEAKSMNRETLARREKVLGPEHPHTLMSMSNLALVLSSQGKYEEAESMNKETLARKEKVLGPEHPETLTSMNNLALVLDRQGKYEEAESMNRETLARREKVLGPEHPDTLASVYNLAYLFANCHRYSESLVLYDRAYTGFSTTLGEDHPTTLACHRNRSKMLASQRRTSYLQAIN